MKTMRDTKPRAVLGSLLCLAALAWCASALTPPRQDPALDARPAQGELPPLPGIEISEPRTAPAPATLERDAALADRFTAEGQSVGYDFASSAGELSIFELSCVGFARGWSAAALLRVLGPEGALLAEQRFAGGVQLRPLLVFLARTEGTHRLEVSAAEEYFRYALVRHSGYVPRAPEPLALDRRERVHAWLAGGDDAARFRVPARAGEELVLEVEGTREEARRERRTALAARLDGRAAQMGGRDDAQNGSMRAMGGRGAAPLFPELRLHLVSPAGVLAQSEVFARILPAQDGWVEVRVESRPGSQAALFDLVVQRAVPTHAVRGFVVDADDEPCPQIELLFLREPELHPWTRTTSDATGQYHVEVPRGGYRVLLQRPGEDGVQVVRAGVTRATELSFLLTLPRR